MFEELTPEVIKRGILNTAAQAYGLETREGGFLDQLVGPVATEIWKLYQAMNAVVPIAFVDESSGGYIDLRCGEFGLTRKPGTKAEAEMTFEGKVGTVVPEGTMFLDGRGLIFMLLESVTLANGTGSGVVQAEQVGDAYNIEADTLTQMVTTLPGLDSWTNKKAAGGADKETDAALVARLYNYLQRPATSGNVYHYERWAMEVPGIGAAKVTPLWNGPGTVKVMLAGPERGPVDGAVVTACAEHIEAVRPVGASVTVVSVNGMEISVSVVVTIDSTTTKQKVQTAFQLSLEDYLKSISLREYLLRYNRVAFLLLSVDGVTDYSALKVNEGTEDIVIDAESVPVLGTVTVT